MLETRLIHGCCAVLVALAALAVVATARRIRSRRQREQDAQWRDVHARYVWDSGDSAVGFGNFEQGRNR